MPQSTYDIGSDTSSQKYLSRKFYEEVSIDRREDCLQKDEVCRGKTDEKWELKRDEKFIESCWHNKGRSCLKYEKKFDVCLYIEFYTYSVDVNTVHK